MEEKIEVSINNYLYCGIDSEVGNYQDMYNSYQECLNEIIPEIMEDCKIRGYNDEETEEVISYYTIKFSNANGRWMNSNSEFYDEYINNRIQLINNYNIDENIVELFEESELFRNERLTEYNGIGVMLDVDYLKKYNITPEYLSLEFHRIPKRDLSAIVYLYNRIKFPR